MSASSSAETLGCTSGRLYSIIQAATQTKPMAPVKINADCQPQFSAIQGTTRIVSTAPILEPQLKMPVAVPRCRLGNHSATVLMQAGKLADSPSPSKARATPKVNAVLAHA